ncbi:hypothetical protein [Anaeromyxobacter sp. PSR-1]|uniref:hypothetical protein n=1 Tax=Anaeromyxobacter sp. PSR-1 TaxID=1300915 RepID=UPI0005DA94F1|nr:hypothetical protein [Anaeromyxobacter sp. PSR-1]GAO01666.1 ribonuclease BN [Anaeromyxobacter sp. PSR-1]
MGKSSENGRGGLGRRTLLKGAGLALGGIAAAGSDVARAAQQCLGVGDCYPTAERRDRYSLFERLDTISPFRPVAPGEMRITFMGSGFPPARPAQEMMSVFVQVGEGPGGTKPDQVVLDCGSGVAGNYTAMNVGFARMDKVFVNHLHGDHMSDLTTFYCFGPATDRKKPLYVWGSKASGVENPWFDPGRPEDPATNPRFYEDGTIEFCRNLRKACRWHTESFSFLSTAVEGWQDETLKWVPASIPREKVDPGDPDGDGFALYAIELDWEVPGVAYDNAETGMRVTHFPVVHARKGSMGFKVEWNGLRMIYTSDTRPETMCVEQASGGEGVDVFIHEMVPPADATVLRSLRLRQVPEEGTALRAQFDETVAMVQTVYENSHTPQGAFGHLVSRITPHPRLTVAAHFSVGDDTIACAKQSILNHCGDWIRWLGRQPLLGDERGYMTWAADRMVLSVTRRGIKQLRADVNAYAPAPLSAAQGTPLAPKYPSPTSDIDTTRVIQPGEDTYCASGY